MPTLTSRRSQETAIDVVNLIAGLVLVISPWVLGFAGVSFAWNAWIVGVVVALVAIGALVAFQQWEVWVNLVLGLWAIFSPWVLGFAGNTGAMAVHVIVGIVVAVLAAVELYLATHRPFSAA
jgi:hypothetical protein